MSQPSFNTPEEFHTKIGLIFNASMAIPLLPFIWLYLEIKEMEFASPFYETLVGTILSFGLPLVSGLIVLSSVRQLQKSVAAAQRLDALGSKLASYFKGLRYLYLSSGLSCLLLALGLYLTGSGVTTISYVILLVYISFMRPTPKKYAKDLMLQGEEKDVILNKKMTVLDFD